jgi:hypothetical protein
MSDPQDGAETTTIADTATPAHYRTWVTPAAVQWVTSMALRAHQRLRAREE